ncbi:YafY family protein [Corynebacterium sp.]|uniref:helix-turn-helix transcriptional regulator n=1 Tax=Corynebacterium sp. TaxID=1720 RepID=UPI0026DD6FF7|nr:WYL domain-containing protein [Corynebacterium sp.]MDO5077379.1 WYL domain-containing protein [Corynebacterium sp.]
MKEQRLGEITRMLRGNDKLTVSILAERCQVSRRTILRDLRRLQRRGVPIITEQGPHGGVSILPGWTPPIEQLTDSELVAFMLPGGTHMAAELGLSKQFHSARGKMEGRLSPAQSRKVGLLQDRLLVVPNGWKQPKETPPVLRDLFLAVASDCLIEVNYQALCQPPAVRVCEPLGLVLANITWYLLARKVPSGDIRTYRADRILTVTRTRRRFERNPAENIADIWRAQQRRYSTGSLAAKVFTKPAAVDTVEFCLRIIGDTPCITADAENDGFLVTATVRSLASAAGMLSGFGEAIEVLDPPELRARIAELARQNLDVYG